MWDFAHDVVVLTVQSAQLLWFTREDLTICRTKSVINHLTGKAPTGGPWKVTLEDSVMCWW